MKIPENLRYTADHEWVLIEDEIITVGVTDHAQDELTDVVFVELPENGRLVNVGDPTAVVESVKAASDIYAPLSGEIIEINSNLESDPALINTDPYGAGWIFKIRLNDSSTFETLMDAENYKNVLE